MLYFGDDDIKDIVIPYGVTKIGYQAFASDRHQIDSITIPDTVTEIDDGAFADCHITSLTIPDSVISIGNDAFIGCDRLESVTIGKNVISIGDHAFSECDNLKRITLPSREFELNPKAFDSSIRKAFEERDVSNFIINYKEN